MTYRITRTGCRALSGYQQLARRWPCFHLSRPRLVRRSASPRGGPNVRLLPAVVLQPLTAATKRPNDRQQRPRADKGGERGVYRVILGPRVRAVGGGVVRRARRGQAARGVVGWEMGGRRGGCRRVGKGG